MDGLGDLLMGSGGMEGVEDMDGWVSDIDKELGQWIRWGSGDMNGGNGGRSTTSLTLKLH